ncbi:transporter substrate-binding domain-containing protein [Auraticoccus sp. F435]|uniref:Transporter substrate-binding domain-containing protein n=1 Tax=Auraticoccus cholistanensis TaxID=2656650 RepID=A0A6A9V2F4_9ACTN|nr:ABC transporter substrate-binding protein [Auraticoccus cholistanensis]MVA77701.1 transporter substrate-binding domain-containing protein [Auraticoccus cholistanensis]
MKRTARRPGALLLAAAVLVAASACSSEPEAPTGPVTVTPPATLVEAGELTYGVAATFPPFEYKDGTELTGFDVDMAESLAGYMGLRPSPLDIDFDGLIPALGGGRVDIINSAMYINEERAEQVDFVPYLVVGEALLVPKGNPLGIATIPDDLSGRTIAVTRGAIGETYMEQFNTELEAKGLEPMTIMALPTNQDALLAVTSGRADGFDTSTPGAAYTLTERGDDFDIAGTFELGTQIGIAVRKGDTETRAAVEAGLQELVADGTYRELIARYNLPPESALLGEPAATESGD